MKSTVRHGIVRRIGKKLWNSRIQWQDDGGQDDGGQDDGGQDDVAR